MDENLRKMAEEFITQRISYHGENEPEAINSAYMELSSKVEHLRGTLPKEQLPLLRECENAYHTSDGETGRFYYKAEFGDAIRFLLDWGQGK